MRRLGIGALLAAVPVCVLIVSGACNDDPIQQPCTNIPEGGCPLSHGAGACSDPACEAIYFCYPNNVWQLNQTCPPHEAGPAPLVSDASDEEAATSPFDANVDAPPGAFGGVGCDDLEVPECSLGFALACGAGCCDCQDLFVCNQGGWDLWGTCGDAGVIPDPRP